MPGSRPSADRDRRAVGFLHMLARRVGKLAEPRSELPEGRPPECQMVETLQIGGALYQSWQEPVERRVVLEESSLADLCEATRERAFSFPARQSWEPLPTEDGSTVGIVFREQEPVAGSVESYAERVEDGLFRVTIRVLNKSAVGDAVQANRDAVLLRSLVSTHAVLSVRGGQFVSLMDPPARWQSHAAACRNTGTWPVLVGEEGDRDTMLSAPIILYDYPQLAPESPGDLFDSTEIDELLTLRIMTLTDDEKAIMAAVDHQTRAILQRTATLPPDELLGLHGTIRGMNAGEDK